MTTSPPPGAGSRPTTPSATRRGGLAADRGQRVCALRRGRHPKQDDKFRFLDVMVSRLPELAKHSDHALVVGDLNVGHTELDIRNWKGNVKRAGFLPEERAYFDRFFGEEIGWKDVHRGLAGNVDGPYTWWSQRGQAFDNDTGWRIDYHMATPALAAAAVSAVVDRAPSWDTRFSDHAPLVVDYRL
ncbi:exodeoxyribonuclease III [Arthrobacter sp. OVS8]|nr:exodeoxyribonuclease III [Arthrobacter sp. OVS8]